MFNILKEEIKRVEGNLKEEIKRVEGNLKEEGKRAEKNVKNELLRLLDRNVKKLPSEGASSSQASHNSTKYIEGAINHIAQFNNFQNGWTDKPDISKEFFMKVLGIGLQHGETFPINNPQDAINPILRIAIKYDVDGILDNPNNLPPYLVWIIIDFWRGLCPSGTCQNWLNEKGNERTKEFVEGSNLKKVLTHDGNVSRTPDYKILIDGVPLSDVWPEQAEAARIQAAQEAAEAKAAQEAEAKAAQEAEAKAAQEAEAKAAQEAEDASAVAIAQTNEEAIAGTVTELDAWRVEVIARATTFYKEAKGESNIPAYTIRIDSYVDNKKLVPPSVLLKIRSIVEQEATKGNIEEKYFIDLINTLLTVSPAHLKDAQDAVEDLDGISPKKLIGMLKAIVENLNSLSELDMIEVLDPATPDLMNSSMISGSFEKIDESQFEENSNPEDTIHTVLDTVLTGLDSASQ